MAGLSAVLLLAAALNASAQSPMPYNNPPDAAPPPSTAPAASTDTAVAASTQTAAVSASTGGVHVAVAEKPKLVRPIRAILHATAKDWEPLSLKAGGDPVMAQTKVVLRQEKVKRRYKGRASPAKAIARLLKGKDEAWLVISVFPKALAARRAHFEVRFRIVENYVEDVKAAVVTIVDRRTGGATLNSDELRARGVEFEEQSPASGQIVVSALDPRPSKKAFNAGLLKLAAFGGKEVGLADVHWSATGLTPPK